MQQPPLLPAETLVRVLRLAKFDGLSVLLIAGVFALLAATAGDFSGALVGLLAAGAGASLILSCDLKVCAEGAKFINAFSKVGLVPDSGMTYYLPRFLGYSLALEHAWLAKPFPAELALRVGWVNKVVPAAELGSAALSLAAEICKMPPLAVALTKRAINRSLDNSLEAQMEYEAQLQEILGMTKDHEEGVKAFLEKRQPVFKGE